MEQMKIYINLLGQKQVIIININRTGKKIKIPPTNYIYLLNTFVGKVSGSDTSVGC